MSRRILLFVSIILASGCQMGDTTRPNWGPSAPAFKISDGAHGAGGNPDFFFLSPMVSNPQGGPNWDNDGFNPNLLATVNICELDATTEAQVNDGAPCKLGGYFISVLNVGPSGNHYAYNWGVPNSVAVFYKIRVLVGSIELGFANVETGKNASALRNVNTGDFVPLVDGRTLPIKFRIERFALCDPPGVGPCASAAVNLALGGLVTTGGETPIGAELPPQESTAPTTIITVDTCEPLNPRVTDLPVFGSCVRVTADPPLPPSGLLNAAHVFVCDLGPSIEGNVASEDQEKRITLHRLDEVGLTQTLTALPHVAGCPVGVASAGTSFKRFFASLARGELKSAGRQMIAAIGPKPLYAAMRLDQGGGGSTEEFSDFQFALPAKLTKVAGTDLQVALPGSTLATDPAVVVTDLGGELVSGARVSFTAIDGSVLPGSFVSGPDGVAHTAWTLSAAVGTNTMVASGRGIAGEDPNNGPRAGIDPFQPIQAPFDVAPPGPPAEVTVLTGSVAFTATGAGPVDLLDFGSGGYTFLNVGAGGGAAGASTAIVPVGWQLPGFGEGGWTTGGLAAFGSSFGPCPINGTFVTPWGVDTDMLFRKSISTPYAGTLTISIRIDNDVQVWLDGVNVSATGSASAAYSHLDNKGNADPSDDWWVHDNCASDAAPTFVVTGVSAGAHTLAFFGHDRGSAAFFDVKVTLAP